MPHVTHFLVIVSDKRISVRACTLDGWRNILFTEEVYSLAFDTSPLFPIPAMTCITLAEYRVLLGGSDGHVYELCLDDMHNKPWFSTWTNPSGLKSVSQKLPTKNAITIDKTQFRRSHQHPADGV